MFFLYDPKYDEPNYNPGGGYYGEEPSRGGVPVGPAVDLLKKYKLLIVVAIIGVVAIVLLMNWLNSNQDIVISVKEVGTSEGVYSNIKINDESGKPIKSFVSTDSATINLPFGDYRLSVSSSSAGAYNSITNRAFTVPLDKDDLSSRELNVSLSRNIDAEISIEMDTTTLYGTKDINGTVIIVNDGVKDIAASDKVKLIAFDTNGLVVNIGGSGKDYYEDLVVWKSAPATIGFTVKMSKAPTSEKRLTLKFKIEGTEAKTKDGKNGAEIDVVAEPSTKLSVTPDLDNIKVPAGSRKDVTLKISNTDKYAAENVLVEIVELPGSDVSIDSFTFASPYNSDPHKTLIPIIGPKVTGAKDYFKEIKLYFRAPANAQVGDKFNGQIVLVSPSLSDTQGTVNVVYNINAAVKSDLQLTGISTLENIKFDSKTGSYPETPMVLNLKNTGNVDVENIFFGIEPVAPTTPECVRWVTLDSADMTTELKLVDVGSIAKGAKSDNVLITINILESNPNLPAAICSFYWFGNVKDEEIPVEGSMLVRITPTN